MQPNAVLKGWARQSLFSALYYFFEREVGRTLGGNDYGNQRDLD